MDHQPENNKTDLLIAYIEGESDISESAAIREWINASPKNREEYEQLFKDYLFIRNTQRETQIDSSAALQLIRRKYRKQQGRKFYTRIAAAASIVLLFSWGIYFYFIKTTPPTTIITPGRMEAQLVLPSGETLYLSEQSFQTVTTDGSLVTVDSTLRISGNASNSECQLNQIIVPRGGEFNLTLQDGTQVWLNAESELHFPTVFSPESREVWVKGEAYFKVTTSDQPFRVNSFGTLLQVYGTEFNINTYREEQIEVVLVKGSVGFRVSSEAQEHFLKPNQLLTAGTANGEITIENVNITPYIAWRNNDMIFVNESLESIMETITRWYDVEAVFKHPRAKEIRYYGDVKRYADIEEILDYLERTSLVSFKIKGRIIEVDMKNTGE